MTLEELEKDAARMQILITKATSALLEFSCLMNACIQEIEKLHQLEKQKQEWWVAMDRDTDYTNSH